jgi:hypothetical protein
MREEAIVLHDPLIPIVAGLPPATALDQEAQVEAVEAAQAEEDNI